MCLIVTSVPLTSGTVVSAHAVEASMLPGLRCLHRDCQEVQPDLSNVVSSIIHDLEDKLANRWE